MFTFNVAGSKIIYQILASIFKNISSKHYTSHFCIVKTQIMIHIKKYTKSQFANNKNVILINSSIYSVKFNQSKHTHTHIYIYIYLLQSRCNNNVRYFPKLLKTYFFVMQIFRSHFGSFLRASNFTIFFSNILQHSPE